MTHHPAWPFQTIEGVDYERHERHERPSLEQRINQLTAMVENMQIMINRLVDLHEPEKARTLSHAERRDQELDKTAVQNRLLKMRLLRLEQIHSDNKREWKQERAELLKKLRDRKHPGGISPTGESSIPTIPKEAHISRYGWKKSTNCRPPSHISGGFPVDEDAILSWHTDFISRLHCLDLEPDVAENSPRSLNLHPFSRLQSSDGFHIQEDAIREYRGQPTSRLKCADLEPDVAENSPRSLNLHPFSRLQSSDGVHIQEDAIQECRAEPISRLKCADLEPDVAENSPQPGRTDSISRLQPSGETGVVGDSGWSWRPDFAFPFTSSEVHYVHYDSPDVKVKDVDTETQASSELDNIIYESDSSLPGDVTGEWEVVANDR